ncbi:erythromycin esterase family protein [Pararhodonellum marinum]|uniref:erythromycin esterase family protein n=1 Tax=Pararhodonellum marinum TaxID=2755358 RepID=UPI00188F0E34|nr:erythromycin esterase family protein [Pararhodonellum marinum]
MMVPKNALSFCFSARVLMLAGIFFFCFQIESFAQGKDIEGEITLAESAWGNFLRAKAIPLKQTEDFQQILDAAGDKKLVLLGEATHGTSEFYTFRSELSKKLITEKGFSFVAVEGNWVEIYKLNAYVQGKTGSGSSAAALLGNFDYWPTWMWANVEMTQFIEWLRKHNQDVAPDKRVGIYGMDLYNMWPAKSAIIDFASVYMSESYTQIKNQLGCFDDFKNSETRYASEVNRGAASCEIQTKTVWQLIRARQAQLSLKAPESYFYAMGSTRVLYNAEQYFRENVTNKVGAWNIRVGHMEETILSLLDHHGEEAKGVVWAHNTHVGDASAVEMEDPGLRSLGELTRATLGQDNVYLVGMSMQEGQVMAGKKWGKEGRVLDVPKGLQDSLEDVFSAVDHPVYYLLFEESDRSSDFAQSALAHRAIGVVYQPRRDDRYYQNTLPIHRYDAMVFFKTTKALNPI